MKKNVETNGAETNGNASNGNSSNGSSSNGSSSNGSAESNSHTPSPTEAPTREHPPLARTSSDEENKENKDKKEPTKREVSDVVKMRKNVFSGGGDAPKLETPAVQAQKRASKAFGRVSKFKHLKGEVILKGKFENVKNLSRTCPAECDFVHANVKRVAVPLTGPGGKVAVFETRRPGRIPDGVTPVLINGATLMDFAFDPFDDARLACACDDGGVRLWRVPEEGLAQQTNAPEAYFHAHADKVQIVSFHPLAENVFLTAAFDRGVKIWDLEDTSQPRIVVEGHGDQLFAAKFSPCGRLLATLCKDGLIRVYEPRKDCAVPKVSGGEIVPKKGARVVWCLEGGLLVVTGFCRQSERQVQVYKSATLELLHSLVLDVSPAILIPHYDEDSSTLFLAGKGESTVTTFEVASDSPHLFPLSPYRAAGLHQGLAFLPKKACDVRAVEFARAYRLTSNAIEPVAFSVPRVKTKFFQDDLFPPTKVTWHATMSAKEWFNGEDKTVERMSLQPEDMDALTENSVSRASSVRTTSVESNDKSSAVNSFDKEAMKKKEADLEDAVSVAVGSVSHQLEQDRMEGVDEAEWVRNKS